MLHYVEKQLEKKREEKNNLRIKKLRVEAEIEELEKIHERLTACDICDKHSMEKFIIEDDSPAFHTGHVALSAVVLAVLTFLYFTY